MLWVQFDSPQTTKPIEPHYIFIIVDEQLHAFELVLGREQHKLSADEIGLQPPHINFASLMDLAVVPGDEEVAVIFQGLLFGSH